VCILYVFLQIVALYEHFDFSRFDQVESQIAFADVNIHLVVDVPVKFGVLLLIELLGLDHHLGLVQLSFITQVYERVVEYDIYETEFVLEERLVQSIPAVFVFQLVDGLAVAVVDESDLVFFRTLLDELKHFVVVDFVEGFKQVEA